MWSVTSACPDVFLLLCHPLQREPSLELLLFCVFPLKGRRTVLWLFWKLVSNVLTSEFWLKDWVSLGVSHFGDIIEVQGSSSWLNYELWLVVFNLEFVTISCELAVTLGFPTLLPANNSQLSSFQRLLPYHQAVISLGLGFFSVIVWPWNSVFLNFLLSLKTRAVHGQFWAGEARALLKGLCKLWLTAWRGINSPHMELQMLYPYNCELYVQLLEQLLLLHHHCLSHICVCSSLSKKVKFLWFSFSTREQWWFSTADLDIYFMVSFVF